MMRHSMDRLHDAASRMGLDDPMRRAGEVAGMAQHAGEYAAGEATRTIRAYPFTIVAAAAALGLFTGFLLTRRA